MYITNQTDQPTIKFTSLSSNGRPGPSGSVDEGDSVEVDPGRHSLPFTFTLTSDGTTMKSARNVWEDDEVYCSGEGPDFDVEVIPGD